jgi:hypothetical protein
MQPNTQDGNTIVKFVLRILEKIHVRSETGSGSETNCKLGSGSEYVQYTETIIPDPQLWPEDAGSRDVRVVVLLCTCDSEAVFVMSSFHTSTT